MSSKDGLIYTPVCYFDLRSGILCPRCEAKLRSGEITELDVEVARLLVNLESRFPHLQKASFIKAVDAEEYVFVVVGRGDLAKLNPIIGDLRRILSDKLGKPTIMLENQSDPRPLLEDLLSPLRIVGMNTVWIPDGTREIHIIVSGSKRNLPVSEKILHSIVEKLYGTSLRLTFESSIVNRRGGSRRTPKTDRVR
ncbi:MAG: hypothetical protein RMJ00_06845 [Nitrososphaerota archaeon]|nr:hypothetical protein [Candidatus Bathyarchaeota archaeon]MCX8161852.1 hypothetical protein [Candidatus Bathyarchaeota archaeon]MDW8062399.1 hypothetical protein [Nitrososphaerota archaeon]